MRLRVPAESATQTNGLGSALGSVGESALFNPRGIRISVIFAKKCSYCSGGRVIHVRQAPVRFLFLVIHLTDRRAASVDVRRVAGRKSAANSLPRLRAGHVRPSKRNSHVADPLVRNRRPLSGRRSCGLRPHEPMLLLLQVGIGLMPARCPRRPVLCVLCGSRGGTDRWPGRAISENRGQV